jgi:serine/threonine-protein kinase RsbT
VSPDTTGNEAGDAELVELTALVRRVVAARVSDPDTVDDVVQETLARVLAARGRLDGGALAPYAVVTARNLVRSLGREEDRRWRHRHRLVDSATAPPPEDEVLHEEETAALAMAWSKLAPQEQQALASHEIEGTDLSALAEESDSTRERSPSASPGRGPGSASSTCFR